MTPKWSPKLPTWSPKMMPNWLYRQDFAKFSLNRHYNWHSNVFTLQHWKRKKQIQNTETLKFDEAHFWLNGYVNKQNCRIWSEANPQVYVETPLHPEKLTGVLYGLVESLVRTSSKTMKATTLQSMVIGIEP
ncbi:hypothetical protein TNCV_1340711 [Trichonephila clavipes]|nr:hypothetical protein TNCV_1340711 [Trichonephila clavipes]